MWGMTWKFSEETDFEKEPNINFGNEELSKVWNNLVENLNNRLDPA